MAIVILALGVRIPRVISRPWWIMLVALLLMTAVFDSLIVSSGIVGYNESKILGVYVGAAPIEDFAYALLAAIVVPDIWNMLGGRRDAK